MQQDNNNTYVEETAKVAEIKDFQGRTRYKVALTDFDNEQVYPAHDDLREFDRGFQVTVVSYCYGEDPQEIVSKTFDDIETAKKFYEEMKSRYAAVVTTETKDFEDIGIYARKTGYHLIMPPCCATCKWACPLDARNTLFADWRKRRKGDYICENTALYRPAESPSHDVDRDSAAPIEIKPQVQAMGLCSGYERRLDPRFKDLNHTERAYREHDSTPEMMIETIAKVKVTEYVENSLETTIIPGVGAAIDDKLNNNPPVIEGNRHLQNDVTLDGGGA